MAKGVWDIPHPADGPPVQDHVAIGRRAGESDRRQSVIAITEQGRAALNRDMQKSDIWLATAMMTQYSSLSALTAFGLSPLIAAFITGNYQLVVFMLLLSIMIWIKHSGNIKRLSNGTETKIKLNKSAAP